MSDHLSGLPPLLIHFVITVALSFLIGLEYHSYRRSGHRDLGFGTTRTFTLLGVFGFVLYALAPRGHYLLLGLLVVGVLLVMFYRRRLREQEASLLGLLLALLVFLVGPITQVLPLWFLAVYVVILILMLGEQSGIRRLSEAFRSEEALTFSKFLVMAGLVLPLLPDRQIAPMVTVTYEQVWMAVVVVSGISYLSYLAQTYFFPNRGPLLTGVLGGLYSSTAATVVLARRVREAGGALVSPALILATAMMYLRLWLLILLLGHRGMALALALPFGVFLLASLALAWFLYRRCARDSEPVGPQRVRHPLELSTAILFALLFVVFAGLTQYIVARFGDQGLGLLAFLTGLSDIDPFILSLLAGHFALDHDVLVSAVLIASGSNDLLKALYAWGLARDPAVRNAVLWLLLLFAFSIAWALS